MRHNIHETEAEKRREYRLHEKREHGEKVAGDLASDLDEKGAVGEVRKEREAWRREHDG